TRAFALAQDDTCFYLQLAGFFEDLEDLRRNHLLRRLEGGRNLGFLEIFFGFGEELFFVVAAEEIAGELAGGQIEIGERGLAALVADVVANVDLSLSEI